MPIYRQAIGQSGALGIDPLVYWGCEASLYGLDGLQSCAASQSLVEIQC